MKKILPCIVCCCCLIVFTAGAQLWSGNLGPDILHEDFGHRQYTLPAGRTTFGLTGGCPEKGLYTISNFLFGCGNKSWVQMTGDHYYPGNVGGNYMLVNAAGTPGTVYLDTIKNLCGKTQYQFAAWVTNVMQTFTCGSNPPLANLTFAVSTLSGTELTSGSTGFIALTQEKVWKQYGVTFKTPADVNTVVVSIKTLPIITEPCKYGSSFAIDDITFNQCGPAVNAAIDGSSEPARVCADYTNPFILSGSYGAGYANPAVKWQSSLDSGVTWKDIPGATSLNYAIPRKKIGNEMFRLFVAEAENINNPNCGTLSNEIITEVHPVPPHNPPQAIFGCTGKDYHLPEADPTSLSVKWTGPNSYFSDQAAAIIKNLQTSNTGIYRLEQLFYFGCIAVDTFNLKIFPGTALSVEPNYGICEGASVQILASAADATSYQWSPGQGLSDSTISNPIAKPSDSTTYKIVITNQFGCKDSALVNVNVFARTQASAGPDKTIITGDTATLSATIKGTALQYYWTPDTFISNTGIVQPRVYPATNTTYTLHVTSTVGCGTVTDDVLISISKELYIPNAFTPNGDGKNDIFKIATYDNYLLEAFEIFDRWGKVVYKASGNKASWDGRVNGELQTSGAYAYRLVLTDRAGKKISRQGTILLLR